MNPFNINWFDYNWNRILTQYFQLWTHLYRKRKLTEKEEEEEKREKSSQTIRAFNVLELSLLLLKTWKRCLRHCLPSMSEEM